VHAAVPASEMHLGTVDHTAADDSEVKDASKADSPATESASAEIHGGSFGNTESQGVKSICVRAVAEEEVVAGCRHGFDGGELCGRPVRGIGDITGAVSCFADPGQVVGVGETAGQQDRPGNEGRQETPVVGNEVFSLYFHCFVW